MDMEHATLAVTGVSGLLGQRLLPLLDARADVSRIVGLDARDPSRRAAKLEFHRVDIARADLAPMLAGVDVVVHLASMRDPLPDESVMAHVNIGGTARLLDAAGRAEVRKIVRVSSAAIYGAWEDNPVPLTEDAIVRPNPGFVPALHDAECERLLAEWRSGAPGRTTVVLRIAPVVGPGPLALLARAALGRAPVVVRDAARPIQVVHVDDAASALAFVVAGDVEGVCNVAADSWLEAAEVAELTGRSHHLPPLPLAVARRVLGALWVAGLGDAPPEVLPYLVHPWVVANDRLKALGWAPRHTNEEAILLSSEPGRRGQVGWIAASAALLTGVAAATVVMRRRRRPRTVARV
jgi:nucleoside-diphosphate-sugar epimerase